jgi:hypothetical protein
MSVTVPDSASAAGADGRCRPYPILRPMPTDTCAAFHPGCPNGGGRARTRFCAVRRTGPNRIGRTRFCAGLESGKKSAAQRSWVGGKVWTDAPGGARRTRFCGRKKRWEKRARDGKGGALRRRAYPFLRDEPHGAARLPNCRTNFCGQFVVLAGCAHERTRFCARSTLCRQRFQEGNASFVGRKERGVPPIWRITPKKQNPATGAGFLPRPDTRSGGRGRLTAG